MNHESTIKPIGDVERIIQWADGRTETYCFKNTVLKKGREAISYCLANKIGDTFDFYISRMIFGDGGTSGGALQFVNTDRNGLFGVTRATKSVIASINPEMPSQVIFTSVLSFTDANDNILNEMALKLNTGDLYSMVTFPDLTKTDQMQITWNWSLNFV